MDIGFMGLFLPDLGQELFDVDDSAFMGALADDAGLVVGGDGEGEGAAIDLDKLALRPNLHADGGGGVVRYVRVSER